jgi:hypothetical protein
MDGPDAPPLRIMLSTYGSVDVLVKGAMGAVDENVANPSSFAIYGEPLKNGVFLTWIN